MEKHFTTLSELVLKTTMIFTFVASVILFIQETRADPVSPQLPGCNATPPELDLLVAKALEQSGLSPAQIESYRRFARWSALLPKVDTKGTKDTGNNLTLNNGKSGISSNIDRDDGYTLSLTLQWDLKDLYYNGDVLKLTWEYQEQKEKRIALVREIVDLSEKRADLLEELCKSTDPPANKSIRQLQGLDLRLDIFTGGWFKNVRGY